MAPPEKAAPDPVDASGANGSWQADLSAAVPAGRWVVDPARSTVAFVARHLLVSRVTGTFTRIAGLIDVAEPPLLSSVQAMADTASLTTGDIARDEHLLSPAFFDVDRWPTLALSGSGLRANPRRSDLYELDAALTIRDVTRTVTLEVSATEIGGDAHTGRSRRTARFAANGTVNRKDFGLQWNAAIETGGVVVGDMVTLVIDAVAELDS